ncbi:TPA: methylenetetrahydrofolate--tRNA-(uracil(54)-C(5))-methyltransferase (FADH(2)-oxidizing) TrmFO [Candidatus Poribacteria bacterium]|nr:methylenetetrahydrofolate--tRNA-(uracil(54)-C(5))-methyltransferase (FADH(2)-oxidizing) TrmFO [Candidatus Poribacteria bacterium]HIC01581.1 methylenetetrahydrofolate--tRNA-(uracil(54)-C(5))-methyltransferase (FADH(2)-oxidizing) TrmFO [Candidatus Poribacteria bacterium]HIN30049.1 methylenetetrahydrofolate--tRNA-(uracil(54)-C(5))-methyltransferase (FADH(2)-oxidizing) TrmFO [Candidatus Poribacteria bacterium]HIO46436.1 methylenetetrahydrofolate--tRNA-(uracil(54)-C(5))-methyltransferase (FADH(2)-
MKQVVIIGGGLAGSEAAWQIAERDVNVRLYEMRPTVETGAHVTADLGELVCSNSLGSNLPDRASGVLKTELRQLGSLLMECADQTAVPAGGALAVDRQAFSQLITKRIKEHPKIEVIHQEITEIPIGPTIIASGPLTSMNLANSITAVSGEEHLYFFDAISPIVGFESINMDVAFFGSRYGKGEFEEGDYINCPLNRDQYEEFVNNVKDAERIELHSFESAIESGVKAGAHKFFEGCLPVEIIAQRGRDTLAYGPMRPVGLIDPKTNRRAYAVVQLRRDNIAGTLYNMVGFQTNLKFPEQKRVFQSVPGLANAEFARYGQMHRNTFISAPKLLKPTMQFRRREDLFFAGQITGVEGYVGNFATGLLAGWNLVRLLNGKELITLPRTTILGSLCHYVTHASLADFQPMKANFGLLPPLELESGKKMRKRVRAKAYAERAIIDLETYLSGI